jgi:trk system potassium uptake protein TrkA
MARRTAYVAVPVTLGVRSAFDPGRVASVRRHRSVARRWARRRKRRDGGAPLHIVIMGCGRVGSTLAHSLEARGHSVAIIDQNAEAFRRLGPDFAGQTVPGVGFDKDTLTQAGIDRADAFAAVSSGDNSNIIAARVARETFGVGKVVARIYDPGRADVYERLGIPTVATVRWTADRMLRALDPEGTAEIWKDPTSTVSIVEVQVHPGWVAHRVAQFEDATGARVAFVMRFGLGALTTPSMVIQDGDQIFLLVTHDMIEQVTRIAGSAPEGSH